MHQQDFRRIAFPLLPVLLLVNLLGSPDHARAEVPQAAVAVVRLVPPVGEVAGEVELEALAIDPEIRRMVFSVDGQEVATSKRPPWKVKVVFAEPAREQEARVVALGPRGIELGADTARVNEAHPRFRLQITDLEVTEGKVQLSGDVSVPRNATLERIDLYLNQEKVGISTTSPFTVEVPVGEVTPEDFLRAVAVLADGREVEDLELIASPGFRDEVDVHLVQLQLVATRRDGAPVRDLRREDFEVVENGEIKKVERLFQAEDVALVLGLVLDSSGSMAPIWEPTLDAASRFLEGAMGRRDRAFLVEFDEHLRMVRPLTGEVRELQEGLNDLTPEGGTALYDSVLFSLLQFRNEPGRRALVVLTDGFDINSTVDPRRSVEYSRKLGVPVYLIALDDGGMSARRPIGGTRPMQPIRAPELKLLTEPTGGRLIRVPPSPSGILRAFRQIDHELRHQYVLTYYTEETPENAAASVQVRIKDRKDVDVRSVLAVDQVN